MTHEKSDASRPNSSETDCASLTGSSAASASERGDAKHDDSLPIPFMFASRETAVLFTDPETDCASLTGSSAASASERGDAKHRRFAAHPLHVRETQSCSLTSWSLTLSHY